MLILERHNSIINLLNKNLSPIQILINGFNNNNKQIEVNE